MRCSRQSSTAAVSKLQLDKTFYAWPLLRKPVYRDFRFKNSAWFPPKFQNLKQTPRSMPFRLGYSKLELHIMAQNSAATARFMQKAWFAVLQAAPFPGTGTLAGMQADRCEASLMDHELSPKASSRNLVGWSSSLAPIDSCVSRQDTFL